MRGRGSNPRGRDLVGGSLGLLIFHDGFALRHPVSAVAQNSIAQEAWTTFLRDCNIELITNQNFALELVVLAFFCTIALSWRTRTFEGIHSDHTHTC